MTLLASHFSRLPRKIFEFFYITQYNLKEKKNLKKWPSIILLLYYLLLTQIFFHDIISNGEREVID